MLEKAKAKAKTKATAAKSGYLGQFQLGPITFDLDRQLVIGEYGEVRLTSQEFGIVVFLAKQAGEIVSKEMLLEFLYGSKGLPEPKLKILDVLICKIRKKLSAAVGPLIVTLWGRGCMIEDQGDKLKKLRHVPPAFADWEPMESR